WPSTWVEDPGPRCYRPALASAPSPAPLRPAAAIPRHFPESSRMSQRLSRKDMKRDEFATVVGRSVEYAETHTRNLLILLGAIAIVGALAGGVYAFTSHRAATAQEALGKAIKVYAAPVQAAADARPNDPETPSFASE